MADQNLEILIKLLADTVGADKVKQALQSVSSDVAKQTGAVKESGVAYAGLTDKTQEYIKKLEAESDETVSLKEKKEALHHALGALGPEYEGLAQYAKFFFNPALAGMTGLIIATELYHKRVEEMSKALAGVQLPDLGPQVKQLSVLAETANSYNQALAGIVASYNSIESQTKRAIEVENRTLGLRKQQIAASKEQALATLEAQKGSITPQQYERRKAMIEHNAALALQGEEIRSARRNIEQESLEARRLHEDAARKKAEAEKITIASPEVDAANKAERDKQTEAARRQIEESRSWINRIGEGKDSNWEAAKMSPGYYLRYGFSKGSEAIGIEQQNIRNAQAIIDANEAANLRGSSRDELRKKRSDLVQGSASEEGRARELDDKVALDRKFQAANEQVSRSIENSQAAERLFSTLPNAGVYSERLLKLVETIVQNNPRDLSQRLDRLEQQVKASFTP